MIDNWRVFLLFWQQNFAADSPPRRRRPLARGPQLAADMALAAPTPEAIARDDRRVARSTPETFFSRGPVSRCPHTKCLATVCRIRGWCHIAWYFRPDLCCANPCRSPEQRFDSVVASVRSLAFAAPRDPATMQAVTDLVPAQPWLQVVLGCLFGEGVSRAPASADVVGTLSTDGLFEERGVWL